MGETFTAIFVNSSIAQVTPLAAITLLLLFMARILPIIALSPFFGARVLPHPVKIAFALTLFVVFLPKLLVVTSSPIDFNFMAALYFIKEIFIGLLLGFLISIPFIVVQTAGMIIDHQRGGASLMVNDPTIQNQSSPLGTLFNMILIYIFFLIDGPFIFIDAILTSYDIIPPDKFFSHEFFSESAPFFEAMIPLFNRTMVLAAQLASPAILAILMTDVFLGITNRLAPQVQITFLGLPLKSLLGLTVICLGWKLFTLQMARESYGWLHFINEVLLMFKFETLNS